MRQNVSAADTEIQIYNSERQLQAGNELTDTSLKGISLKTMRSFDTFEL